MSATAQHFRIPKRPLRIVQLYEHVCDERECTDIGCSNPEIPAAVLLKPAEYDLVDEAQLPELVKLLSIGQLKVHPWNLHPHHSALYIILHTGTLISVSKA